MEKKRKEKKKKEMENVIFLLIFTLDLLEFGRK